MSYPLFSPENIRLWDQHTMQHEPITSADLMERAATQCTKHLLATNLFHSAAVFCGIGNNGGDGLVIARLLAERGIHVSVFIVQFSENHTADFDLNQGRLPKQNITQHVLTAADYTFSTDADLIVDAIFGSGLNKPVSGWVGKLIDTINNLSQPVIAIDIPSGLFCQDNRANDFKHVIRASQTISFQTPKMAFLYAEYSKYTGDFKVVDIGLSDDFKATSFAEFITRKDVKLRRRHTFSHKGTNGYLFLIAGFQQYAGAAILASRAAMRTGCGYVAVHCSVQNQTILQTSIPECLYIDQIHDSFPEKTHAVGIGPGLGTDEHALNLLTRTLSATYPLVLDADALNLLSSNRTLIEKIPAGSILTPHAAELKRLIGSFSSPEETLDKQVEFSVAHKVFIIQKGAYSKITTPEGKIFVNGSGNPGMGTAGMGDVLTGIIGSMLAQRYSAEEAAIFGTFIHGYSADLVKREHGENGMIASDVIDFLPKAMNSL
ncbi:MAG: NAD(P)H-hydrate dehydratase [Bacteroidetes bacterium]|nr:NAD(P)H-hydrate dehydratase [Bacteroidota bacterium]